MGLRRGRARRGDRFLGLNGTLAKNLGSLDATPAVTAEEAMQIGKSAYTGKGKVASAAPLAYSRESTELIVFPGEGRNARVAWHVQFFTELQAGINPGLWNYFIDAKSGEIFYKFNGIHTLEQASGPGGNDKVPRQWTAQLDVEPQGAQFVMQTARLVTTNMNNGTSGSGTVVVGPLESDRRRPIMMPRVRRRDPQHDVGVGTATTRSTTTGSHPQPRALQHQLRERVLGRHPDDLRRRRHPVHPLSGDIDVVVHEINHGFTTFHSNLIYARAVGGLNESFSDNVAGTIVEFFNEGDAADFDVGRDIFQADAALRFMCDPPRRRLGRSLPDYVEGMDGTSRAASEQGVSVWPRAVWPVATRTARPPVSVAAWRGFYRPTTASGRELDLRAGCDGVMGRPPRSASPEEERPSSTSPWQDVGVFCDGAVEPIECDETLTAESGTITSPNFPANYPDNFRRTYCIQPASGSPATLTFTAFNTEAGFDFVRIRDANGANLSNTSGTTAPEPETSTLLAITFSTDGSVTAPGWSADWATGGTTNDPPPSTSTRRATATWCRVRSWSRPAPPTPTAPSRASSSRSRRYVGRRDRGAVPDGVELGQRARRRARDHRAGVRHSAPAAPW